VTTTVTPPRGPEADERPATPLRVATAGPRVETRRDRRTRIAAQRSTATWVAPAGLALLALVVRLFVFRGLWVDEAISVDQAHMSFGAMLENLRTTDLHPPLHHAFLWLTERAIGTSEFAVRLPSLVAGVLLVLVLYATGKELYDRRTGLIAAAITSVAPFAVWYSQEARMYGLLMLWSALAVWIGFRALRRNQTIDWVLLALVSAAIVWTQYLGGLLVAAQQLVIVVVLMRRVIKDGRPWRSLLPWAVMAGAIVVLLAPLVPFGLDQLHGVSYQSLSGPIGQAAPKVHPPGIGLYTIITNGVWAAFGYHADGTVAILVALWPAAVLLALFCLGRGWSTRTVALLAMIAIPVAGFIVLSLNHPDLFTIRYLSAIVPLVLLLLARLTARLAPPGRGTVAVVGVVMLLLGVALVDQQLSPDNPRRYDDREAVHFIDHRAQPGDEIIYAPTYLREVVHYYAPEIPADNISGGRKLPRQGRVFVVGSFFDVPGTYAELGTVLTQVKERGHKIVGHWRFVNVQVWELAERGQAQ
jgi:uncharacterized membrane protein